MADQFKKRLFHVPFAAFLEDLTIELYKEGFLILGTSDIRKILKESLQLGTGNYEIISVIVPHLFHEMLTLQPFPGFVLPGQLTVFEKSHDDVEVVFVNPTSHISGIADHPGLKNLCDETDRRMNVVLDSLLHQSIGVPDGVI